MSDIVSALKENGGQKHTFTVNVLLSRGMLTYTTTMYHHNHNYKHKNFFTFSIVLIHFWSMFLHYNPLKKKEKFAEFSGGMNVKTYSRKSLTKQMHKWVFSYPFDKTNKKQHSPVSNQRLNGNTEFPSKRKFSSNHFLMICSH